MVSIEHVARSYGLANISATSYLILQGGANICFRGSGGGRIPLADGQSFQASAGQLRAILALASPEERAILSRVGVSEEHWMTAAQVMSELALRWLRAHPEVAEQHGIGL